MLYKIDGGGLQELPAEQWAKAQIVVVSNGYARRKTEYQGEWHGAGDNFWLDVLANKDIRFESHIDFDLICVPSFVVETDNPLEYPLYLMIDAKQLVIMTHDREKFQDYLQEMYSHKQDLNNGYIIYQILESLVEHEEKRVEEMEQEVGDWEDSESLKLDTNDYLHEISRFRKHLLLLKHFYEHLRRTIEYLADNDNGLFDERIIKRFTILENCSLSMLEDIQLLREEVMQLKEGYQAQQDLKMNKTMQFLTVVTTIFMPLTLLAGWYGMNLKMPEYEQPLAYPILIVLSLLIIGGGIWICKKKKWF